jgi:hypothetical protein
MPGFYLIPPRRTSGHFFLFFLHIDAVLISRAPGLATPRPKAARGSGNSREEGSTPRAWRCPPPALGAPKAKEWTRLRAARSWRSSARRRSLWTAVSAVQRTPTPGVLRPAYPIGLLLTTLCIRLGRLAPIPLSVFPSPRPAGPNCPQNCPNPRAFFASKSWVHTKQL